LALSRNADELRVVLFDVGGVLVELSGVATIQAWQASSRSVEDIWRHWLGSPTVRAFETGRMETQRFASEIVRELELKVEPEEFLRAFVDWPSGLYPGTLELLSRIPKRYRRALLSNSNALHWPRVIDEMALGSVIDDQFVSHLTGKIKPDVDAFEHALQTLDCAPRHVLFLDDNQINVNAARSLGIHAERVRGVTEVEQALNRAGIFEQ
jgi:HAD superfamily hydrolase (TIGR01509 family)